MYSDIIKAVEVIYVFFLSIAKACSLSLNTQRLMVSMMFVNKVKSIYDVFEV
jgi:hypothetical protein